MKSHERRSSSDRPFPEEKAPEAETPRQARDPWESIAGQAIRHTVPIIKSERPSLDGIVRIFASLPGATKIIDERPQVVMIVFEDGSGVGVSGQGIDLLQAK
jgi:hypothetical protein